jgi:hypothetical protein
MQQQLGGMCIGMHVEPAVRCLDLEVCQEHVEVVLDLSDVPRAWPLRVSKRHHIGGGDGDGDGDGDGGIKGDGTFDSETVCSLLRAASVNRNSPASPPGVPRIYNHAVPHDTTP